MSRPAKNNVAHTMSVDWHQTFASWARPPSETEEGKAERAARMIREALRTHDALRDCDFDIVATGSYRNNTNVKAGSDVDLAAVLRSAVWHQLPLVGAPTREALDLRSVDYGLPDFRRDVHRALRERFGATEVSPGKIAFTIDENRTRLDADVTPYLIHRRYTGARRTSGQWAYDEGIETRPADAPERRIIQWPEQHYAEAVNKNEATNRRYKRVVRILKRMRDHLREHGTAASRGIASNTRSCFIESAVFNAPNALFNLVDGTYYDDVRAVVADLWQRARAPERAVQMTEVSRLHPLFRQGEPWSPKLLEDFSQLVWQHVGFSR